MDGRGKNERLIEKPNKRNGHLSLRFADLWGLKPPLLLQGHVPVSYYDMGSGNEMNELNERIDDLMLELPNFSRV